MSIEELRALIEPYLDSKGYEKGKGTRTNARSYVKKMVDFMHEKNYSEISEKVISEYIKSYEGTSQLGARKLRCEEFAEYVKGERQKNMFEEKENAVVVKTEKVSENEVATDTGAISESEAVKETETNSDMASENEEKLPVQADTDMIQERETPKDTESESAQSETGVSVKKDTPITLQAETPKTKGRPKKAPKDRRENSFTVYLNAENAEALRDFAFYERKDVSVFLAEIIEQFISRNVEALNDYRTFQKTKKKLK